MKSLYKSLFSLFFFLAIFLNIEGINAQTSSFWRNNWVVGISPGIASFYGDMSNYDTNPVKTLKFESGPAIGLISGKKLNNFLEIGLVASFGKISAEHSTKGFHNRFSEFGVYSALSVPNSIDPRRNSRFDFGLMVNYNITHWRSILYTMPEKIILEDPNHYVPLGLDVEGNKTAGKGKTIHHFGVGYYADFTLNPSFTIRLSQTIQFLGTDEFDSFIGNTSINDRLFITGIGLVFTMNYNKSSFSRRAKRNEFENIPSFN